MAEIEEGMSASSVVPDVGTHALYSRLYLVTWLAGGRKSRARETDGETMQSRSMEVEDSTWAAIWLEVSDWTCCVLTNPTPVGYFGDRIGRCSPGNRESQVSPQHPNMSANFGTWYAMWEVICTNMANFSTDWETECRTQRGCRACAREEACGAGASEHCYSGNEMHAGMKVDSLSDVLGRCPRSVRAETRLIGVSQDWEGIPWDDSAWEEVSTLRCVERLVYTNTLQHACSTVDGDRDGVAVITWEKALPFVLSGCARTSHRQQQRKWNGSNDLADTKGPKSPVVMYDEIVLRYDVHAKIVLVIGKKAVAVGGGLVGSIVVHHSVKKGYVAIAPECWEIRGGTSLHGTFVHWTLWEEMQVETDSTWEIGANTEINQNTEDPVLSKQDHDVASAVAGVLSGKTTFAEGWREVQEVMVADASCDTVTGWEIILWTGLGMKASAHGGGNAVHDAGCLRACSGVEALTARSENWEQTSLDDEETVQGVEEGTWSHVGHLNEGPLWDESGCAIGSNVHVTLDPWPMLNGSMADCALDMDAPALRDAAAPVLGQKIDSIDVRGSIPNLPGHFTDLVIGKLGSMISADGAPMVGDATMGIRSATYVTVGGWEVVEATDWHSGGDGDTEEISALAVVFDFHTGKTDDPVQSFWQEVVAVLREVCRVLPVLASGGPIGEQVYMEVSWRSKRLSWSDTEWMKSRMQHEEGGDMYEVNSRINC